MPEEKKGLKDLLRKFRGVTFLALLILVVVLGSWGAVFTDAEGIEWYYSLPAPYVRPPPWVFMVVWPVLYLLMAMSATRVWESSKSIWRKAFIYTFGANLVFNSFWSALFFGFRDHVLAFVDLFFVWATIIALMWLGWRVSKKAVYLLVPYLVWVTFAGTLLIDIFFV